MRLFFLLMLTFCLSCDAVFSQSSSLGSWNILNVKYNLDNKFSIFGEAQLRSLQFYNNFHYYEYKAGVNYKVHNSVTATLGLGSYQTYKEGGNFVKPKNNDELRIWPQIIILQPIGKLKIEHRYRAEFRFTSDGYRNRFRFRLALSYPFGKMINGYEPFHIGVSDEIFFTNNEPYFERNRFLLAFNYKPSRKTTLQVGYLSQFDYKIDDETGREFLQFGFFFELYRKQSTGTINESDLKDY